MSISTNRHSSYQKETDCKAESHKQFRSIKIKSTTSAWCKMMYAVSHNLNPTTIIIATTTTKSNPYLHADKHQNVQRPRISSNISMDSSPICCSFDILILFIPFCIVLLLFLVCFQLFPYGGEQWWGWFFYIRDRSLRHFEKQVRQCRLLTQFFSVRVWREVARGSERDLTEYIYK